jgi:hypothetical protein
MSADHVIRFDLDGSAVCLWSEAAGLPELGKLDITRASSVEFDPVLQLWHVILSGDAHVSFSSASRAECIRWEIETINRRIEQGRI